MKNIFKTMLTSFVLSTSLLLTSCGSFSMEDDYTIGEIKTEELQNGDILITIIYQDEKLEPTTFIVPKGNPGEDGVDGNAIDKVVPSLSKDEKSTILTIYFTDPKAEPVPVTIPHGKVITGITEPQVDENGNTTFKITYSDDSESALISIPQGKPVKDGVDGKKIELQVNDTHIQFRYEGDTEWTDLVSIESLTGTGIKDVDLIETESKTYEIKITYTNGNTSVIDFDKPNRWYSEPVAPKPTDGYNGDMWFNTSRKTIYIKENGAWREIINLSKENDVECEVIFDLNTNTDDVLLPSGTKLSYTIIQGSTFYDSDIKIPEPLRYGYDFAGWYTTPTPTVVNGMFTDLTIVTKVEMTLYAKWVEKDSDSSSEEIETN